MSSEIQDNFHSEYQAGKTAFESGKYRESVQHLEKASNFAPRNSHLQGEVQIWLITAYEAADQRDEAIALCQKLNNHPHIEIRKQSRRLLYIMEAPQLVRRPEWLTEIPDLAKLADGDDKYRQGSSSANVKSSSKKPPEPQPIDLSQVNTKDNRFIWVALLAIALILGSLIWFNY